MLESIVQLTDFIQLERSSQHVHLQMAKPHRVASSAVYSGGLVEASHLLNLKVPKHAASGVPLSIEQTFAGYAAAHNWQGALVGMMTAASMDSLRIAQVREQGIDIAVLVTSGLDNARCVGDTAEYRGMINGEADSGEPGTINIVVVTSARLSDAAMLEAIMIATEAKCAALQQSSIQSPVSNRIATGTGTDSVAIIGEVISGKQPANVHYCGKHVRFGELIGKLTIQAVSESIQWEEHKVNCVS